MKKTDVTTLGELLIDFTENGLSNQGNPVFEANPGGAPGNVLAMLGKLNRKTEFIGKVGADFFGRQLKAALEESGIGTAGLRTDSQVPTTLALVHMTEDYDREFSFYRNPGADMMLNADEVAEEMIAGSRIFHFGTLSMTHEPVNNATVKALTCARQAGCLISFDPNLRMPLWQDEEAARAKMLFGMQYCQVLKIADNEIVWLTGQEDYAEGVRWIRERFAIPLILVTMGRNGSRAYYHEMMVEEAAFPVKPVDTTGAGDTFMGCVLDFILEHGVEQLAEEDLRTMLRFANAAAAIVATRKGALRVMPAREEIMEWLEKRRNSR